MCIYNIADTVFGVENINRNKEQSCLQEDLKYRTHTCKESKCNIMLQKQ